MRISNSLRLVVTAPRCDFVSRFGIGTSIMSMSAATIPNATRTMSGGRALGEMLALHEVGPLFGMGGFQLLPFYEACRALGLRHTLINDERCGAFAADAYARVTNRPGVVDATLGPGATNLVTALAEIPQCRHPDDRDYGQHQPRAFLEEHDAGSAPARRAASGREGRDPHRDREAHPGSRAPCFHDRDIRPARAGADRRS